jgi:hypothetical protein
MDFEPIQFGAKGEKKKAVGPTSQRLALFAEEEHLPMSPAWQAYYAIPTHTPELFEAWLKTPPPEEDMFNDEFGQNCDMCLRRLNKTNMAVCNSSEKLCKRCRMV